MPVPARAIAERRIAEYFLSHDAVRADSAIDYAPTRLIRRRALERLKDNGVVRGGANGRWFLDAPAWTERRHARRKRAIVAALVAVIAGAAAAAL